MPVIVLAVSIKSPLIILFSSVVNPSLCLSGIKFPQLLFEGHTVMFCEIIIINVSKEVFLCALA